jgi:uncharacterized membrane-anchored protein YitT (DUF2179 family)
MMNLFISNNFIVWESGNGRRVIFIVKVAHQIITNITEDEFRQAIDWLKNYGWLSKTKNILLITFEGNFALPLVCLFFPFLSIWNVFIKALKSTD